MIAPIASTKRSTPAACTKGRDAAKAAHTKVTGKALAATKKPAVKPTLSF